MGFYDSDTGSPKKQRSTIAVAVPSAIIGGIVAVLLTPFVMNNGWFNSNQPATLDLSGPKKTTTVQVNSQITEAVKKVKPAVVGVINLKNIQDPFAPQQDVPKGTGSGVIFDKGNGKARIVTNYHVIEGNSEVKVVIPDGAQSKEVPAKVLGSDQLTDLAVLEISDQYVKAVAEFGNSDALQAGEPAIAIGNPLGLEESVTVGVISSANRTIEVAEGLSTTVIQTDAAINPGNSGGALINAAGQIIGINRLKISEAGVEGLGFAIPSNDARPVIDSLIQHGNVPRAYMGVSFRDLKGLPQYVWENLRIPTDTKGGAVIINVSPDTPAASAGLKVKDVIVALDGNTVTTVGELRRYLYSKKKIGESLKVTYYRDGKKQDVELKLGKAPTDKQ